MTRPSIIQWSAMIVALSTLIACTTAQDSQQPKPDTYLKQSRGAP